MKETTQLKDCVALIGIDWADQKHDVALCPAGQTKLERSSLHQSPEAIALWVADLRQRFGPGPIAICLEQSRGALIYALMAYDNLLLYPINPQSLAKLRGALYPSGKKDDPVDAALLLQLLQHFGEQLRPWEPEDVTTRQLLLLVEARRGFVDRATSLVNQLQSVLKSYFPQALALLGEDLSSALGTDFLKRWCTLQAVQKARPTTLRAFYYGHNSRSEKLIQARLELVQRAKPLTQDPALLQAQGLAAQSLALALAALRPIIARYDSEIARLFAQHPDAFIFASVDGAGAALAPRLLVSFGTDRQRFADAEAMPCYSGTAPITEKSGKQKWVHRRWARPVFHHQSWIEHAEHSLRFSAWAKRCHQHLQSLGMGHWAALRVLAIKWQRILWRCWQNRVAYDEATYVKNLQKRGLKAYADLVV